MDNNERLKLSNQLCFPLYACGKEIVRQYKPFLDEFNLTYTQYIVLLVLWEKDHVSVKEIGEKIYLDSGTLTPLLNKLENKGLIKKETNKKDERGLLISLTKKGSDLKSKVTNVPTCVAKTVCLNDEEAKTLYNLLYKMLGGFKDDNE